MSFLDYFRGKKTASSANVAKERLQIIVAHERGQRDQPDYLPKMQQEILEVIRKYVQISDDMVQVDVDRNDNCSVLELNVTLPERGDTLS
ncbi:cell division topological specificity factor MinE [Marinobacter adhaerens]|uniref:Cell division topological specificity factor n=1 Tax=Marinobacter adhaerens TaxID=1033846 RepID=A0A851I2Z6_9GAMM|nr:cell division topological specificity factor MinE [Marinobacter adhaerens]NWN92511.1 cell division topological specificity factor MinE [Marinobacter adhaerens]